MAARDWEKLLAGAPTRAFANRLVRCVPQLTFQGGSPPSYLFTSGAVNRCNPAGVRTIYLSEDRETAHAEYAGYYRDPEPELLYHADFQAAAYVDLGDANACRHFGFTNAVSSGVSGWPAVLPRCNRWERPSPPKPSSRPFVFPPTPGTMLANPALISPSFATPYVRRTR